MFINLFMTRIKINKCTEVHQINSSLQCLFVMTVEDCVEVIEYLDYNYYIFCTFTLKRIVPAVVLFLFWLGMLFVALGVTSNYFLCPALFTISKHLGLSQNVAGVTLLAFGNGAPDIFSSVAGLQKASPELAIASLVGAGIFVTSVVAGSVFITQSFNLMMRPFLRDVCFYMIAISWTFGLFFTGKSFLYHGIGFVALYFVYIVVVLGSRVIYVNQQKTKDDQTKKPKNDQESGKNSELKLKIKGKRYVDELDGTAVVLKAFYYGGFEWIIDDPQSPLNKYNNSCFTIDNNCNIGSLQSIQSKGISSTEKLNPTIKNPGELYEFMIKICPINIKKWPHLVWWKRIAAIFKSPSILIMRLTVPVLDTALENQNWNRLLACVHCVTGPLFILLVSKYASYMIAGVFPAIILVIILTIGLAMIVFFTSERFKPPQYHWLFAYLGFVVSVTWIYCLANEIVALLQVFGFVFNLSDAILGLTILAWGNSLSDFLSNVAVARKEFPRMGISACFGGPLLALLLGLGIPCIIEIVKGRSPPKHALFFSGQFAFLFGTISISLISTATLMIIWKFETKRFYGAYLIILYVTFVILSIMEELKVFQLPL